MTDALFADLARIADEDVLRAIEKWRAGEVDRLSRSAIESILHPAIAKAFPDRAERMRRELALLLWPGGLDNFVLPEEPPASLDRRPDSLPSLVIAEAPGRHPRQGSRILVITRISLASWAWSADATLGNEPQLHFVRAKDGAVFVRRSGNLLATINRWPLMTTDARRLGDGDVVRAFDFALDYVAPVDPPEGAPRGSPWRFDRVTMYEMHYPDEPDEPEV